MNHLVQRYLPTLEEKQGIFRVVISFLLKGKQCCQVNTQQEPWLVVMSGDNSCSNGCGFESRRCILDGHLDIFSHCFCCKNCIVCLKRPTINEKEAHFFKKRIDGIARQGYSKCLTMWEITRLDPRESNRLKFQKCLERTNKQKNSAKFLLF